MCSFKRSYKVAVISVMVGEKKGGCSINAKNLTARIRIKGTDFGGAVKDICSALDRMKKATDKIIFLVYGCCYNHTLEIANILRNCLRSFGEEARVFISQPDIPLMTIEEAYAILFDRLKDGIVDDCENEDEDWDEDEDDFEEDEEEGGVENDLEQIPLFEALQF